MNKKKVSLPVADVSGQTEHAKKTYVAPACSTVAVENEGCICVSVTLNPQGSSEPNTCTTKSSTATTTNGSVLPPRWLRQKNKTDFGPTKIKKRLSNKLKRQEK